MYKIKNGLCPNYISRLFITRSNQYNLRNNNFIIPRVNATGYGKHSVRYLDQYSGLRLTGNSENLKR